VQQQALRDFAQAMRNFFSGTHRRPAWRKAGVHEGFRQVALKPRHVERVNGRFGRVWVPKVGWVRFGVSWPVPAGVKSYRVTRGSNRRARTKLAIANLRAREADRRKDWVEKVTTDFARRFDVIRVEALDVRAMTRSARAGTSLRGTVRAKRFSSAEPASLDGATPTSTLHATSPPDGR
jgi:hypothetical protein